MERIPIDVFKYEIVPYLNPCVGNEFKDNKLTVVEINDILLKEIMSLHNTNMIAWRRLLNSFYTCCNVRQMFDEINTIRSDYIKESKTLFFYIA